LRNRNADWAEKAVRDAASLSSTAAEREKVIDFVAFTVDELMADEVLLAKIISECRNNPGALRQTPNCQNAEAAEWRVRLRLPRKSSGG